MKAKITNIEISSTLFLLLFSCTLGIAPFISIRLAGIDTYISAIIGAFLGIIPLGMVLYIFNYQIDKPINEKTKIIFGNVIGTIINILSIPFIFIIGITYLFNLGNFVISQYLTDTPLLVIIAVISLTALFVANKGIKTITKTGFIYSAIIVVVFLISVLGLFQDIKLDNLKPILEFGVKKPLLTGLINTLTFTTPIYMILFIPKKDVENNNKTTKYFIISYIMSMIIISSIAIVTSSILGKYLLKVYQYPVYITLKRISLFNFIDRIENFLSFQWILSGITVIAISIYSISKNIKNNESKLINLIVTILMIISSYLLFKNNTSFNEYLYKLYPYLLIPIFIIYVIIFIGAIIRKRKK